MSVDTLCWWLCFY